MNEDKIQELREATRLANQALKDLKAERKEAEKLLEDYREWVITRVEKAVETELKHMTEEVGAAIDKAQERVDRRFDTLANIMMGEDKKGRKKGTLQELVAEWIEKQ